LAFCAHLQGKQSRKFFQNVKTSGSECHLLKTLLNKWITYGL
jgi:hypothetical protein